MNELFGCLESLQCNEWNHKVDQVITNLVNQARVELGKRSNPKIDKDAVPRTVCVMTETKTNSVRRNYASKNC